MSTSTTTTSSPTDSSNGSLAISYGAVPVVPGPNTQKPFTLSERLGFEIHRYSSYSPNYLPE